MYQIDLGLHNPEVYRGCKVTEYEPGKFRLDTIVDSAVVMVASNLSDILRKIPKESRGRLVITGATLPAIMLTAQSILGPHFKQIEYFDGKRKHRVSIPSPPESHNSDPE
ncbi:MAG TPA: hypothetical protein VHD69_00615 [Candidatus Paceibacterota bacterium]|nr:hypothetical protein [Candidatus Paceibacterota bacterium]